MSATVAVCIPSIPPRADQLSRAIASVLAQDAPVSELIVAFDMEREGHAATRNRAWRSATSEWIAFLDDDDELDTHHVSTLLKLADESQADIVFSWHRILQNGSPANDILNGRYINDADIAAELEKGNFIPVTVLVKREMLEKVGGFPKPLSEDLSLIHI